MSVGPHPVEAHPIAHLHIDRHSQVLRDDIHTVAGHAKKSRVLGLEYGAYLSTLQFRIELVIGVLEADTIHQGAVEAVINRVVHVIAWLAIFQSHSQHSR